MAVATDISDEAASEAETVAAAVEEQTSTLTDVSHSANDLTERATLLTDAMNRFETGDPDATDHQFRVIGDD
ncbi:hypothetical protein [Natrinema halophilum]|uniref:Methyl-accepting chemotaxis protein n=1 Tax=Natrinema halophilum TaxID=1699371 RepID=A0A7D5K7W9_9EURY|nr:hypothetical protein [Natrinema halophilum]QLG50323.1 hypothetical protein HYG82_16475 [Natrinema halophilum]